MKPRLFLDTNIVLDLLGERAPWYEDVARLVSLADRDEVEVVVSVLSYATVAYFLAKENGSAAAQETLRKLRVLTGVSVMDAQILDKALNSGFADFEDGLQYYSAEAAGCGVIITRNAKDYAKAELPVMTAGEWLAGR